MDIKEFETILKVGEHIGVEFKTAKGGPKDDTFETVCSFLNRFGGDIFLGVTDAGEVVGVPEDAAIGMIKNIIKVTNNPELLKPTFYVYSEAFVYRGKTVIRVHVPPSSDVHRYKGVCYDRVFESDVQVQTTDQIAEMYIRKRDVFTERKLFPYLKPEHLRLDLLPMIRNLIYSKFAVHPWLKLDDDQLLTESGLYEQDFITGKKSFNAAAVLLLGRDDVLFSCFPTYKTDALMRRVNVDRYDDRDTVTCNLVEAYDRLMAFGAKHLPDKFYLEDAIRLSLRDKILREVVGNTLVHREFSSSRPSRLIIYKDRLVCDNASKAMRCGPITPDNLSPVSKNPIIARFFKQMGRADELGSGTRNLFHYTKLYSNAMPILDEGDTFAVTVPLDDSYSVDQEGLSDTVNETVSTQKSIEKITQKNYPVSNGGMKTDMKTPEGGMKTSMKKDEYTESTQKTMPKSTQKSTQKQLLNSTDREIVRCLSSDGRMTISQLAKAVRLTDDGVKKALKRLKDSDAIRRVGPDKGGHWEVIGMGSD